jgi:hypothetical protein
MTLSDKQAEFTRRLSHFLNLIYVNYPDIKVVLSWVMRSYEEQKRMVAKHASKTLKSKHLDKLAADLLIFDGKNVVEDGARYQALAILAAQIGLKWLGEGDVFHFQYDETFEEPQHLDI